jgi:hypothetical protein
MGNRGLPAPHEPVSTVSFPIGVRTHTSRTTRSLWHEQRNRIQRGRRNRAAFLHVLTVHPGYQRHSCWPSR